MRAAITALSSLLLAAPAFACTTFLCEGDGRVMVGKSYDWHQGEALVLINKRGMKKKALSLQPGAVPAEWTSKFASVTFNQYGREMPNGGMNTRGLVVEIMWLRGSEYPPVDKRPALTELQWIQYQLDRFSTTRQVVENAPRVRVAIAYAPVHYLVCDRSGDCAAFEYLEGKLKVSTGDHVTALTNDTHARSERWLEEHPAMPRGTSSLERFGKARRLPKKLEEVTEAGMFEVLDAVRQGDYSKWGIVYDPIALTVVWRTHGAPTLKRLRLNAFDPSCKARVRMLRMGERKAGDVTTRFEDYTLAANKRLLEATTRKVKDSLPPGAIWLLAGYPETNTCTE